MSHADAVLNSIIATDSLDGSESESGDEAYTAPSGVKRARSADVDAAAAGPSAPLPAVAVGAEFADEASLRSAVAAFAASTQPPTSVKWRVPYGNETGDKRLTLRCICEAKNRRSRCRWAIHVPFVNDRLYVRQHTTLADRTQPHLGCQSAARRTRRLSRRAAPEEACPDRADTAIAARCASVIGRAVGERACTG